jgi:Holliday junction resolvase RusA-like endonuclease
MKPDAKVLRQRIMLCRRGHVPPDVKLLCTINVGSARWFNKGDGKIKKRDLFNVEKFLVDSLFQNIEADDSQIFEGRLKKIVDDKEWFEIVVSVL